MDEKRIVELLTRKIAREATAEELGELSYLLKKYPDSVYYDALLEQVWDLGRRTSDADVSEAFLNHKLKFKEELRFRKSTTGIRGFFRRPAVFAISFSFIFFAAAAYILNKYDQRVPKQSTLVFAARGIRKEVKLPDGTLVWLNSDSRISYDSDMLDKEFREVSISGEAYFNVRHDDGHPFIVKTKKVVVRAVGTEFNIKEYAEEDRSETTLLSGSIELVVNDRLEQKFLLKPSEKFALVRRNGRDSGEEDNIMIIEKILPVTLDNRQYIRETSWAKNKLVFNDESFEMLIPKLERWYNVRIDLTDQQIKSFRFTAVFTNENIVEALERLKAVRTFKYDLTARQIRIY